jgi:hypothetical protein
MSADWHGSHRHKEHEMNHTTRQLKRAMSAHEHQHNPWEDDDQRIDEYALRCVLPQVENYQELMIRAAFDGCAQVALCNLMQLVETLNDSMTIEGRREHNDSIYLSIQSLHDSMHERAIEMARDGDDACSEVSV